MKCPKCDYLMSAFDSECPKCHGKGIARLAPTNLPPAPPPSPVVVQANDPALIYCSNCGQQHIATAVRCTRCKTPLSPAGKRKARAKDGPSLFMAIIGFLFPLGGILIWMLQHNEYEERAASAGKGALIGVFVGVVGYIIYPYLPALLKSMGY